MKKQKELEEQLQQSKKLEALGTLAGGIAHDFNNLLMGIQGRTSLMLLDTNPAHPHFEHLKSIEGYVKSAADLTKQLLGFARQGRYHVKPSDMNALVKKTSQMFGRTRKEITTHVTYQEKIWSVEIDQGQIEQVLLNLYRNALQAMPAGGDLHIYTENVLLEENYAKVFRIRPGRYVKVSVIDTGIGMDEATKQRVFEPFFTTKGMGRGTGLGLASAYGIIKNHGGVIHVYSEKGEGTTFDVYLPASEQDIIKEEVLTGEMTTGSRTILLVDDEAMIIEVGKRMIEKLGYEVFVAKSGMEAIEIYHRERERIDLVILDMIMPNMSGSEAYDRLRSINPGIKVLLSSGYSINGEATEILNRGCNGFIQKPFNLTALSQKINVILSNS